MAPLKPVTSLYQLSEKIVLNYLKDTYFIFSYLTQPIAIEEMRKLPEYFDGLPVAIQDELATKLMDIGERDTDVIEGDYVINDWHWTNIVYFTLKILFNKQSQKLRIKHAFHEAKSDDEKKDFMFKIISNIRINGENLRQLVCTAMCSDEILEAVGKNCRKLKELEIADIVSDQGFHWILPSNEHALVDDCYFIGCNQAHGCPELVNLQIKYHTSASESISYMMKTKIIHYFKNLKSYSCDPFTFDLSQVADTVSTIEHLELTGFSKIIGCHLISKIFPRLKSIQSSFNYEDLICLSNCSILEKFGVNNVPRSEDESLILNLIEKHPNVMNFKILSIPYKSMLKQIILAIGRNCPNIEVLQLCNFGNSNNDISINLEDEEEVRNFFVKLKELAIFAIRGKEKFLSNLLSFVLKNSTIEKLNIGIKDGNYTFQFDTVFKEILTTLPLHKLQELRLEDPGAGGVDISEETMKILSNLPEIRKIILGKPGINNEVFYEFYNPTAYFLDVLKTYANENNYDIEYEIHGGDESSDESDGYDYDETDEDEESDEEIDEN